MKVLVIHGHPEATSFGTALASAYEDGARGACHDVRSLKLSEMDFDPVLRGRGHRFEAAEPDIEAAREAIAWAEHLVIQYPTWWASVPALLKGFFDRTLVPGFAYRYHERGSGWDKLLKGRSARLLVTMDAPAVFDSLYYFASSRRAVSKGVLGFCGIAPTHVATFSPIKRSSETRRAAWLDRCRRLGAAAS